MTNNLQKMLEQMQETLVDRHVTVSDILLPELKKKSCTDPVLQMTE